MSLSNDDRLPSAMSILSAFDIFSIFFSFSTFLKKLVEFFVWADLLKETALFMTRLERAHWSNSSCVGDYSSIGSKLIMHISKKKFSLVSCDLKLILRSEKNEWKW